MAGPLSGVKILEIQGIGPGPFATMMLSDMGAEVVRIDRVQPGGSPLPTDVPAFDFLARGRRSAALDLKQPDGVETLLRLVEKADVLLEGFRPGVMERLGLGPDVCLERNPGLVYARMTGWGQDGPLAHVAGHDINYIALAGALAHIGRAGEPPLAPLNLVGDFGGGGMLVAYGIVCALVERATSGQGQVVDAAMVDGVAALMSIIHGAHQFGWWHEERGTNMLDGGAHFYEVYETKDGKYVSIGSIESQFYAELIEKTGLGGTDLPEQMDRTQWSAMKERLREVFVQKTRDEWCEIMEGSDVCFAPVLSMREAPLHPHNRARGTFVEKDGTCQAAPAPRFSRSTCEIQGPPPRAGEHTDEVLSEYGFSGAEVAQLRDAKAVS
ncbi:MAG: CaiB/BaiF CoA-transferase family protein [Myxococcota bacterium]|nr:carnitine dehydratase [Deltaproteobacteria bacterium]MCP4240637.1 CoA transferase [bacterium]MDP6076051.1 CaiB/BaiF CoA-transferase family protein [Myxococcota bacterium]MDP7075099.1 CaiB/BaiF CoA-transferase family protein [Myxococcota bacterium]MDP7300757.1 CaiB/BaiF CoA-transferase family protein [Myxococcota bacterium]